MKNLIRKIIHPFFRKYHFWYHKKPRKYCYEDVYTIVQPGVFSPVHTVSTRVFLDFIARMDVRGKRVLELGCGSGIISLFVASRGALVTATDINPKAIASLRSTAAEQNLGIDAYLSDLFDDISSSFDFIVINPPYFPRNPGSIEENAWFCGENFEYFRKLFYQLKQRSHKKETTFIVLSDDCDISSVSAIASQECFALREVYSRKLFFETIMIFKVVSAPLSGKAD